MPELPRQIRTPRLTLRPFSEGDVADIVAYRADPRLWEYLRADCPPRYGPDEARIFLQRVNGSRWDRQPWYAICLDGVVVGDIDLIVDAENRTAEVGYTLGPAHWGRGLATEAAVAVIDQAFAELGLSVVWAETDERNAASWRVMEKLGMRREGVLRRRYINGGVPTDWAVYSVLAEEWATRGEETE